MLPWSHAASVAGSWLVVSQRASFTGRIRNGAHAQSGISWAHGKAEGGIWTGRMRPEWQEWHFVSPGEGRRWPKPELSACGQSGVTVVSRGHMGGQTVVAKFAGVAFCEPRVGQMVAESATVRMWPEWQE